MSISIHKYFWWSDDEGVLALLDAKDGRIIKAAPVRAEIIGKQLVRGVPMPVIRPRFFSDEAWEAA